MGAGRGRRTGLVLIVVIILLLLVGVIAIVALPALLGGGGGGQHASNEPTATPVPTTVKVIIAARDLPRGTRLSEQDVTTMEWPMLPDVPVPTNALTVSDSPEGPGLDQVNGSVTRVDILANQPVLSHMITPPDQPAQLASVGSDAALKIPKGMVAIAFPIDRMSSVAYALREGDHVDVLMSFRFVDLDEDFQTALPNAVTTFQGGTGYETQPNPSATIGLDTEGKDVAGAFGLTLYLVPGEQGQRPRQSTQLVVDNVVVMRVGDWPLTDVPEAVVVTQAPQTTPEPNATAAPAEPTPVPQTPTIVTLVVSRQDALVLKFALEVGADIDFALRSAYDNDLQDVKTETVTLDYIFKNYNLGQPPKLPIGFEPGINIVVNPNGTFAGAAGIATPPPQ